MRLLLTRCLLPGLLLAGLLRPLAAQTSLEPVSSTGIYNFLDELASLRLVEVNQAVQPYSREFIGQCLLEAEKSRTLLSRRQQKELDYYLLAWSLETGRPFDERIDLLRKSEKTSLSLNPLSIQYRDSLLRFSLQPVLGGELFHNQQGSVTHRWWGASVYGSVGRHFGVYASLRDNWETEVFSLPSYFTQRPGGNYKLNSGTRSGGDYSEMKGGISWSWKWGYIGLLQEQIRYGSGYNGAIILSGRAPATATLRLNMKPARWLELNYIHASLISEVVDSNRSYITPQGSYRKVFQNKYLASTFITLSPWKSLQFSLGNSIIYSDKDIQLSYLIPVMFYKSIDHTINHGIDNENSQLFLDMSFRPVQHLHLYGTFFVDEWKNSRVFDKTDHNFLAGKAGMRLSGWPLKNVILTGEYFRSNPITYKHRIPSLSYASNQFFLGSYLGDNSDELFCSLSIRPAAGLDITGSFTHARHGNEYAYDDAGEATHYPVLKEISWDNTSWELKIRYQPVVGFTLFAGYQMSDISSNPLDGQTAQYYLDKFTPAFFQGKNSTISGGFALGLR